MTEPATDAETLHAELPGIRDAAHQLLIAAAHLTAAAATNPEPDYLADAGTILHAAGEYFADAADTYERTDLEQANASWNASVALAAAEARANEARELLTAAKAGTITLEEFQHKLNALTDPAAPAPGLAVPTLSPPPLAMTAPTAPTPFQYTPPTRPDLPELPDLTQAEHIRTAATVLTDARQELREAWASPSADAAHRVLDRYATWLDTLVDWTNDSGPLPAAGPDPIIRTPGERA